MNTSTRLACRIVGAPAGRGLVSGLVLAAAWGLGLAPTASQNPSPPVDWVELPAGTFMMGCVPADRGCDPDERPRHRVELTRPFAMMRTEVTVGHVEAVARRANLTLPRQPRWSRGRDYPVVNITWGEARDVCIGLGGRLPTEAEWEYAARGGLEGAVFPWGDEEDRNLVNIAGRLDADTWRWAAPVGSFPPNGFGLHDVSGNVWEWVADWYAPQLAPEPVKDPRGPEGGDTRVLRGGSWDSTWPRIRVSVREGRSPAGRYNLYVGVRCARDTGTRGATSGRPR